MEREERMHNLNLVLRFTVGRSDDSQVRGAARIRVDGLGGILVYDAETGKAERISLADMNSLSIHRSPDLSPTKAWIN
jgi:hypothetical protein